MLENAFIASVISACFVGVLGDHYQLIDKVQTQCELEAINYGTRLADQYQSFDENTEWDQRIHHDYLVEYLGFAGWIVNGLWKSGGVTAGGANAGALYEKGGWAGSKNVTESGYWALEDKWLYMMGDSTQRQVWATFVSPFQNNQFERNAKEWTRENCARQYPHRKEHPSGGYFPEEGWGGKCGNNEVTCHLSGYGNRGKITFDWKHFPYEDYDEWLWGSRGLWRSDAGTSSENKEGSTQGNDEQRFPDIVVVQVGLHTCFHAWAEEPAPLNTTMIRQHGQDLKKMMKAIRTAIDRTPKHLPRTTVIIQTSGRIGNTDKRADECIWRFNRIAAFEAHLQGFIVLEREELERRLLYKSEHNDHKIIKSQLHLENPSPNIVGTALLVLLACLQRNGNPDAINAKFPPRKNVN